MHKCSMDECFYGAVTVGERGQIVIPAEARAEMGVKPGDKLLVMKHPLYEGLMISRFESVRNFLDEFNEALDKATEQSPEKDS